MTEEEAPRRRSRIGLYAPIAILAFIVAAWSVAWIVIREQTRAGLDTWIANEASAGRLWSCADRAFGGFPFRIELSCSSLTMSRTDAHLAMGRLLVVAQLYNPRHVIAQLGGPLRIEAGTTRVDGNWGAAQASIVASPDRIERLSIVAENSFVTIDNPGADSVNLSSRRFEFHVKPRENEFGRYDVAMSSVAAVLPGLDFLVGGTEPADLQLAMDVTQVTDFQARPLASRLDLWRAAGGRISVTRFSMAKGNRRAEANGRFGIDELRRVEGRADISAAGLGGVLGRLAGAGLSGALIGVLMGVPEGEVPSADPASGNLPLKPLPTLELRGGRVLVGSFPIPGVRLPPLY